jgi:hypothetical protein
MIKVLILFFIPFITSVVLSQNSDTNAYVKTSLYGRLMPISVYSGAGYIQDKIAQSFELGFSHGVIDAGLCFGSYTQRRDTTSFLEFKITMDASQYGIFSNEFSIGFGRVFHSKTPIMLEASYTIMAQLSTHFGIGISTGYYDFAGDTFDLSKNYYGLFIRYGLMRDMNGRLNRTKLHHRRKNMVTNHVKHM